MLINYSISGNILVNGEPVTGTIKLRNLTNPYIGRTLSTDMGFYAVNLASFPDRVFNVGDIVSIEVSSYHNGISYYDQIYFTVEQSVASTIIDANLIANWNFSPNLGIIVEDDKVEARFNSIGSDTTIYTLYIKREGVYVILDTKITTNPTANLVFTHTGEFKLIAYMVEGSRLLGFDSEEFNITMVPGDVPETTKQATYFDWE